MTRTTTMYKFSGSILLLVTAVTLPLNAYAYSPEGYPGSTWGNFSREFDGLEGSGTQGNVIQGVQWLTLPGQIPFETYGIYRWRFRTQNRPFYNTSGPGVGGSVSKWGFDLGAEFDSQKYPELRETTNDTELYLQWYERINLARSWNQPNILGMSILGAPLSSWGRLTDDFSNLEGRGTQGWISQGIDWFKLPGGVVFQTYASYYWRYRTENRLYYNADGPSLGIDLGWKFLDLSLEYNWQHYPELHTTTKDYRLYLTWYYGWDLKDLRAH